MDKDRVKDNSMSLVLAEQRAIQNELANWTYQAEMYVDLISGISETLEVKVGTSESDTSMNIEMVDMTISFNDLGGNAYQFQTVLKGTKAIGTSEPIVRIGIPEEQNTQPSHWYTLQEGTIHALKQISASSAKTSVIVYLQLSGLSLPYVKDATTSVNCSMGDIHFTKPQYPDPKYIGRFDPLSDNKLFSSMETACEAVLVRALPIPIEKVRIGCQLNYSYVPEGAGIPVEIPVALIPFEQVDHDQSFATIASNLLLTWLKAQGISGKEKGEFLFTLSIYPSDESTKTPWLIIDSVVLPLSSVQINS